MKVDDKKMKAMESLFRKVRKGGLNKDELKQLAELSAHFLFIAKASEFTLKEKDE